MAQVASIHISMNHQSPKHYSSPHFRSPMRAKSPATKSPSAPPVPGMRIPSTLQAVFLASNRGRDVNKPPPGAVAHREFFRSWWGKKKSKKDASPNMKSPSSVVNTKPTVLKSQKLPLAPLEGQPAVIKKKKPKSLPTLSPQQYLDAQCRSRGYNTERYKTLQSAYHNKPTQLQQASYDVYLISLVKTGETAKLKALLDIGISPNPCNQFGESLLHLVCRLGRADMLQLIIDAGGCLQIADDYGRTPLHDACWGAEPNFDCVRLLLQKDIRLFYMTDARGAEPLNYVRREHWTAWIEFLESVKEQFWSRDEARHHEGPPPLVAENPNSRPIPDPVNALSLEMTRMVVAGKMTPTEALLLLSDDEDDIDDSDDEDDSDDDGEGEDQDDEYYLEGLDDVTDDGSEMDAGEMAVFLHSLNSPTTTSV